MRMADSRPGEKAAELLLSKIRGPLKREGEIFFLQLGLIVRESTGPAKSKGDVL